MSGVWGGRVAKGSRMTRRHEQLLRAAVLLGAITDALVVVPMLSRPMLSLLWGFDEPTGVVNEDAGRGRVDAPGRRVVGAKWQNRPF